MSLPWLVAVPKPHIHYARDHYWKYLIHILCLSASKKKGIHWSEMKLKQSTGLKPAKRKNQNHNSTAWLQASACSILQLSGCSCGMAKEPSELWALGWVPELCNASGTQIPAAGTCREQGVESPRAVLGVCGMLGWAPVVPERLPKLLHCERNQGGEVHVRNSSTFQ